MDKVQARANFLAALHKEIAIQKITAYLAVNPAVNVNALPERNAAAANSIPQNNVDEYQNYPAFIRN